MADTTAVPRFTIMLTNHHHETAFYMEREAASPTA